jgi:hypothetical protein
MVPMVIVPDDANGKTVVADAGTIIKLADQHTLYRNRVSPVTRRADELLIHYGKAKTPTLGWITHLHGSKAMKPSRGPTFLVTTKQDDALMAWEKMRLKVGRARKPGTQMWIVPWLMKYGKAHPRELREVTRFFGGKPIANEEWKARVKRLFTLIYGTEEFDMATEKGKKHKKTAPQEEPRTKKRGKKSSKKPGKKAKQAKPSRVSGSDRITVKHDAHVIKRLVQENPRRAGSQKAKVWDKLKKGMTVGEFVKKGGNRGAVRKYIEHGWIKLLKPRDAE